MMRPHKTVQFATPADTPAKAYHSTDTTADISPPRAILDSGATGHFLPMRYKGNNEQRDHTPIKVQCADGQYIESQARDALNIPHLDNVNINCMLISPPKSENMVGHEIAARQKRSVQRINNRTATAAQKATKVSNMATTRKRTT